MFYTVHKDSAKCVVLPFFFFFIGQGGMEETNICPTLLFFSSFTTKKRWRFFSEARMRQENKLLPSALIISTLCVLSPTLFQPAKKHTFPANYWTYFLRELGSLKLSKSMSVSATTSHFNNHTWGWCPVVRVGEIWKIWSSCIINR